MVSGRLALITGAGAAGGVGLATARALALAGCRLAITDSTGRIHTRAAELLAEGHAVNAHQVDLSEPSQVQRLLDAVGPIDILITTADLDTLADHPERDAADRQRRRYADLTACVLVTRAFLPGMVTRRWGRVVMIAPLTGPLSAPVADPSHAADGAGLTGLARTVAQEVAAFGVTVNMIAASHGGRPEDLAAGAALIASQAAAGVTGAVLVFDQGHMAQESKA